jgi:hypothetical protein
MRTALMTGIVVLGFGLASSTAQAACPEDRLVAGWYEQYLGRSAYVDELPFWTDKMHQGVCADDIRAGILGSDEYYNRRGLTPEGFAAGLYADILGRNASDYEIRLWAFKVASGVSRSDVAREFIRAAQRELAQRAAPVYVPATRRGPETLHFPLRIER